MFFFSTFVSQSWDHQAFFESSFQIFSFFSTFVSQTWDQKLFSPSFTWGLSVYLCTKKLGLVFFFSPNFVPFQPAAAAAAPWAMVLIEFEKVWLELKLSTGRHNCFNFPPPLSPNWLSGFQDGKKYWPFELLLTYERDLYITCGLRQIEYWKRCTATKVHIHAYMLVLTLSDFSLQQICRPNDQYLYAHNLQRTFVAQSYAMHGMYCILVSSCEGADLSWLKWFPWLKAHLYLT